MKKRQEVKALDKWNVEALYTNAEAWEQEYLKAAKHGEEDLWPDLSLYRGRLGEGVETYVKALETLLSCSRQIEKLYTYAHLRHDEEITVDANKVNYEKILNLYHEFMRASSWFEPETLSLEDQILDEYIKAIPMQDYSFYLQKLCKRKEHTLPEALEELMALSGKSLQTASKAFSAINNADFRFGSVLDEKGEERELTHASYQVLLRDHDRTLRKNAFQKLHGKFATYENTLGELLSGQVQTHLFSAKARRYSSCLEAALFPKNIDAGVLHSLIEAVHTKIGSLHKYVALRKQIMGVEELHLYDMYVPLVPQVDVTMDFDQAVAACVSSVQGLGSEYQELLQKGLVQERWVDRFENENKRSGAYSSGCFDSMPYILMNYKGDLRDVFTLAHEAGHSMHSLLSRKAQPYHYADYPIFVAEVASTFNEELLMVHLLEQTVSKEERIYLINQKIEDIRATLFRQTMFAEFELLIHTYAEKGGPLTPGFLKSEYRKLNEFYFGDSIIVDEEIESEWSRIPHFYYNFYVYQYATGISAALCLTDRVLQGGEKEREAYLNFLKGGGSAYPLDLLKSAGVDMTEKEPVLAAIGKFERLVDELESLMGAVAV